MCVACIYALQLFCILFIEAFAWELNNYRSFGRFECVAGAVHDGVDVVQMADFLQVAEQRERITDWLRSLLHSLCGLNHKMVEEKPECERAAPDARELKQMLHDTQVRPELYSQVHTYAINSDFLSPNFKCSSHNISQEVLVM